MAGSHDGWTDLTLPITEAIAKVPVLPCPAFERLSEQSPTSLQVTDVRMATHIGTHFDAASHAVDGGPSLDEYGVERWVTTATICDVDVGGTEPIEVADLGDAAETVREGDALVLRTGWEAFVDEDRYHDHPYVSEALAEWLVEQDLAWVGMDLLTPDKPTEIRPDPFTYPVHTTLLGNDVLILENLTNLAALPAGPVEVVALPTKWVGVDGAPARVVARPP